MKKRQNETSDCNGCVKANDIAIAIRIGLGMGGAVALLSMSTMALAQSTFGTMMELLELDGGDGFVIIGAEGTEPNTNANAVDSYVGFGESPPLLCNGLVVTVNLSAGDMATNGDDVILGTAEADSIMALAGNDTICSQGGDDIINAGGGDDWIDGGKGDDDIKASGGIDMIFGGTGNDLIRGGLGDDYIEGEQGDDTLLGQGGNDMLDGGSGVDGLFGGSGNDTIFTGSGATVGSGIFVSGGGGNDTIHGGPDADDLRGTFGTDKIHGRGGNDIITGGNARDTLDGGDGNDTIRGQGSPDTINGGNGADTLYGGEGDDVINAGAGADVISGGPGNDILMGGAGSDGVKGGLGNDELSGGSSAGDVCDGQSGTNIADASCETIITATLAVPDTPPVNISEFVASNEASLLDNTGDNADWIELHNTSATQVNLAGWTLTAGSDTHVFTSTVVGADGYLVLFASGDTQRTVPGELHVDFKLSAGGESLILTDDSGVISSPAWVSAYPAQTSDVSYGLNTAGNEFFFNQPTPGTANTGGVAGFVAPVTFSLRHGFYETAQSVELSTTTASAMIHYTTDGSTPSVLNGVSVPSGTAIAVNQTTVLRAVATRRGWESSPSETRSYLFASEIANRTESTPSGWPADNTINGMRTFYGMDTNLTVAERVAAEVALTTIPSISITTDLDNLFDPTTGLWANPRSRGREWERPVAIELIDPTGAEPGFEINGGLRIKGGGSRNPKNFKHSMRLVFNSDYGDGELNYPVHGSDGVDIFESLDIKTAQSWSWNRSFAPQLGRGSDADWLRDIWNRETQGAMGHPYTRSKYVHVFINGQYWGLYYTEERTSNQYASQYLGGNESDYDVIKQDTSQPSLTIEARDGNVDAWISMWSMVEDHQLNDEEWARFQNEINVVNLADFYLLMWLAGDSDSTPRYTLERSNNWLALRDRTGVGGKWHFIDKDSESALCTNVQPERMPDWNPTPPWNLGASLGFGIPDEFHLSPAWLMEAALTRPEFVLIFQDRVQRHMLTPGGALTISESIARLDNHLPIVDAAIDAEAARWGNTWVEPGFDRINWELASQNIRNCFALRTSVMLDYLSEDGLVPTN